MTTPFQLRVQVGARDLDRFPEADEALGESLFAMLVSVLDRGLPRPSMMVFRPDQIDRFDVVPVLKSEAPHRERMMAAIGGQAESSCAALVGVFRVRFGPMRQPQRAIICYLEWPDNRWWTCWQLVDEQRALIGEEPIVRRAVDGWPRPGGVGGWYAMVRRTGLRLRMMPSEGAAVH
jgi:hypothetical protein